MSPPLLTGEEDLMPADVAAATAVGRMLAAGRRRRSTSAVLLRTRLTVPRAGVVERPDVGTCVAAPLHAGRAEVVRRFPGRHAVKRWHAMRASDGRRRRGGGEGPLPPPSSARTISPPAPIVVN